MPETPTVVLRAPTPEDRDVLFAISADLDTWEERNPSAPRPTSRQAYDARVARANEANGPDDPISFVVEVDGVTVGSVALFDFDSLARHAEMGVALVPEARGRGVGTAAITQLVEFAFTRCNLRRIHLQAIASNAGAIRAYEKAGFVLEGRQRQHAWVRGAYEDIVRMGILREEHAARATSAASED